MPAYLLDKKNTVSMLIFTAVFALVFINAYKPFNVEQLYPDVDNMLIFGVSSLLILLGLVIIGVSRFVLCYFSRKRAVTYLGFGVWVASEMIVLAAAYTFLASRYLPDPEKQIYAVMLNTLRNTSLVIALPYAFSFLYFALKEYSRKLAAMDELAKASAENGAPSVLSFFDSKGDMKFSIKRENLLYIEAADNYVYIWYTNKGKVEKFLLRVTLKNLETKQMTGNIRRCHRSYMVNFDCVSLIRREKEGQICAVFGLEGVPDIPISNSYADAVTSAFLG